MLKTETKRNNFANMTFSQLIDSVLDHGPALAKNDLIRQTVIKSVEKRIFSNLKKGRNKTEFPPGVQDDRALFAIALLHTADRALSEYDISERTLETLFDTLFKDLLIEKNYLQKGKTFRAQYNRQPPTFLLLSPGKGCNLRCSGCYADSGINSEKLSFSTMNRIIGEMKDLWGSRFVVISGGEPTVWRSEGKCILDIAEAHPDCFFMMYTNGTLIDEEWAERLRNIGNLTPAISVEGWEEKTDARRGKGVYQAILESMDRLHDHGVPFGISLTGTRQNYAEILSDEFLDYFYFEKHALYAWLFQYQPIGRSYTLNLMPTPEQRLWMWKRSWEYIREKKVFLADFWNSATLTKGCLSAGGQNNGGYLYIDWNGNVSPCVFLPYSPVNIHDIYNTGGTLNQVWDQPFFNAIRDWQKSYQPENMLTPCPYRDHYRELRQLIRIHNPLPIDQNAQEALQDPDYAEGLAQYDREYQTLTQPIWKEHYLRDPEAGNGKPAALPDIDPLLKTI